MWFMYYFFLGALTLSSLVHGQLSGSVGPLTSVSSKKSKAICNVLDYGAKADNSTDLGTPLLDAFNACIDGGLVYVPSGNYVMENLVTLSGANAWALQIDGIVYRTGGSGGATMISIENSSDFELFSSTSSGAIQGAGYLFHISGDITGPRLLRLTDVDNYSVHDFILVDAPSFHFVMDTCSNGEVYNMAIRGGNSGGLDGIDVWGTNIWIHDVSQLADLTIKNIDCSLSGRLRSQTKTNVSRLSLRPATSLLKTFIATGPAVAPSVRSAMAPTSTTCFTATSTPKSATRYTILRCLNRLPD